MTKSTYSTRPESVIAERLRRRRTLKRPQETSKAKTSSDVLGVILKLIALLAVATYIFGYGAAVAYSEIFGVPQLTFFSSPMDLIGIAADLIPFVLIEFTPRQPTLVWMLQASQMEISTYCAIGVGVALTWWAFAIHSRLERRKRISSHSFQILPSEKLLKEERWFLAVPRALVYGGFVTASLFLVRALIAILFFAALTLVMSIGLLGYFVARSYAELEIIRPETCRSILSRQEWIDERETKSKQGGAEEPKKRYARCVKVILPSEGKQPQQIVGRVLLGTSEYIVLYDGTFDKEKPRARRIPIKSAIVESADESDDPRRKKDALADIDQPRGSAPSEK